MNRRINMRGSQNGFTIVELIIALGIALIIVLGLYAFLVDTQRSYLNVTSNDQNDRRSKNAATITQNLLQQAGFVNYRRARQNLGLEASTDTSVCSKWNKVCISSDDPSEIYVRYYGSSNEDSYPISSEFTAGLSLVKAGGDPDEPDMRMYDCSGRFLSNKHLVTEKLFLDEGNLYCEIVDDQMPGGDASEKLTGKTYLVERNIEKFAAFAMPNCLDSSGKPVSAGCAFKKPSQITDWTDVIAVKFVLVQAEESGQKVMKRPDGEKFTLWGKSGEEIVYEAPADSKVRRMLSASVFLRNE